MKNNLPLMIQCDFDGTATIGDLSFLILDNYTTAPWRQWFADYTHGKMTVNEYNIRAFSNVIVSKEKLDQFTRENVVLRDGLVDLLSFCKTNSIRFYFVSNGMSFYIETVLDMLSYNNLEFAAAKTIFTPNGIKATYYDPNGKVLNDGFKVAYTNKFKEEGYRIAYIGNGLSDFKAASMCDYIWGIESLAKECDKNNIKYNSFNSLAELIPILKTLI